MAEIERKFLVRELPDLNAYEFDEIEQGYLCYEPEIRLRKRNNKYYLTQKGNGSIDREEIEYEIPEGIYKVLYEIIISNKIKKTRYLIPLEDNLLAELDIYHDYLDGLTVVEVEFDNIEQAINYVAPSWFGEEVTYQKHFKNKNLAQIKSNDLENSHENRGIN